MTDMLFYNVWRTETPENQARLIEAMREEAPKLAAKPGFLSMTVLESQDGRVLVEGRWASREAFDAAVSHSDDAQASRRSLEAFGTAEPGVFTEAFRIGPVEAPPADYPSPTFWDRFARREVVANGLKLSVVEGGQGEPVLLVPGMLETWAIWSRVMPRLADRYRVIAPDLRGFGESEGTGAGYNKVTLAADLLALLDALSVGRVHVVGHDFGGQVAYALAAEHRDRVATLSAIEALLPGIAVAPRGDEGKFWLFPFHMAPDVPEMLTAGREREYVRALWDLFVEPDSEVSVEDRAEVERVFAQRGALTSGFGLYRATPKDIADLTPHYANKLTIPVLALGGEHCFERRTLETFQQVATDVTGGVIEGAAHFAPLERNEATARPLLEFLAAHPIETDGRSQV
ncbi:putative epoxide hydrolase (plasmid) [Acidiphilium multivorum AIU301]|uniref:Putative epoxide hydrolase n=1 Tax=Acidiphilium multivorum (strain DSM 11245 / JCM 8867 / NBRC 100883 / AIU 301) TaxID=926570 RepID=F0J7G7_ACIMA|nr:alpha/beta fold hydrolase [Acidiphilium multivorum]BAJ83034.1 putative epoxide hydrolase [Acidiphilium multivorum AIU301]GAN75471.1 epoxide hydrolase [Acidiphilium multivorum AIU301]